MKVKALKGFVHFWPNGDSIVIQHEQEFELPEGVTWLQEGLVVPVVDLGAPEKAVISAPEKRKRKPKKE